MQARYVAALVAAAALALVACDGETTAVTGESSAPWLDPDASWMLGEGTPIAKGISIPAGARLSGPILLSLEQGSEAYGVTYQTGQLFVDGEPYRVASDFHDQWQGDPSKAHLECKQKNDGATGDERIGPYTGKANDEATAIDCSVTFELRRTRLEGEVIGEYLTIHFTKNLTKPGLPAQGRVNWFSPPIEVPDSLPPAPPDVDGPDFVESRPAADYLPDLRIVDGSFLAAPPGPGGVTGGYTAWIGVSGDADEVFDAYVAQALEEPSSTDDREVDGMRVRQFASSDAGGVTRSITMNEIDGNAWIYITAVND